MANKNLNNNSLIQSPTPIKAGIIGSFNRLDITPTTATVGAKRLIFFFFFSLHLVGHNFNYFYWRELYLKIRKGHLVHVEMICLPVVVWLLIYFVHYLVKLILICFRSVIQFFFVLSHRQINQQNRQTDQVWLFSPLYPLSANKMFCLSSALPPSPVRPPTNIQKQKIFLAVNCLQSNWLKNCRPQKEYSSVEDSVTSFQSLEWNISHQQGDEENMKFWDCFRLFLCVCATVIG